MMSILDAALEYGARGWRVMPVPLGRKHPSVHDWQNRASSDPEEIKRLFARPWAFDENGKPCSSTEWQGVSIATGALSGVWVLDVDIAEGKAGDESLADLEAEYGRLPETYEVVTGRGGRHLYFRWDDTHPVSTSGGVLGPGLDVRGAGGQVLAPPSRSPEPGYELSAYTVELGGQDRPAEAPLWLRELLSRPTAQEPRRERLQRAPGGHAGPGDVYAERHTWPELLEADGAHLVRVARTRSGLEYELWARPGREGDAHGASLYYEGKDVLKVFTSSWPGLTEGATYTRFGYYAATRHGGDHSEAARALREAGYRVDNETLVSGTAFGDFGLDLEGIRHSDVIPNEGQWPDPVPFPEREHEAWPIETLPEWLQEHCEAVAVKLQVPVDLCAQLALGVASAMCMGHVKVEVHPGWEEHVNLYLVTAMLSGTGKSPATKVMAAPVYALEKEMREQIASTITEMEKKRIILTAKVKNLEKGASSGSSDPIEYLKAAAELDAIVVPEKPKLLIDDATPEVLVKELDLHKGRMAVISPEGEVFDMVQGTYARAGKANINVYLKGWSAEPVRVNRKGQGQGMATEIEIEEAILTICVAVQPSVLENIARDEVLSSRGFTARFMPCVPMDTLGSRNFNAQRSAPPLGHEYQERMVALGRRMATWTNPLVLKMDEDAADLYEDWRTQIELKMNRTGDLRQVSEWVSKIIGTVARLAGLLTVLDGQDRGGVSVETMRKSIQVGDYWIRQAIGLTTGLWEGTAVDVERCQRVCRYIAKGGLARARVAMRDLRRAMKWSSEELADTIGDLEALSYLVLAPPEGAKEGGRPKLPDLVFHPSVVDGSWLSAPLALLAKNKDSLTTTTTTHHNPLEAGAKMPKVPEPEPKPEIEDDGWEGIL